MTRNKVRLTLSVSILAVATVVLVYAVHFAGSQKNLSQPIDALHVSYDYPVALDLQQMVDSADYIVVGKYTGLDSTWNMRRNPNNILEEDPNTYVEGRLYNFTIEKVLKGSIYEKSILVNHRYSETVDAIQSNAVVDSEGRILEEATESKTVFADIISPLFIEPELDCEYILFLMRDSVFNNYYASIEPFSIKIEDGKSVLESNLIGSAPSMTQRVKASDTKQMKVIIDVGGISIDDKISGQSAESIIQEIQEDIGNPSL